MLERKRCLPSQPADQLWSGAVRRQHAWFYTSQGQCKLVSCTDLTVLFACDKVTWERLLSNLVPMPGSPAAAWSKEASESLGARLPWSAVEQVVPGPQTRPCLTIPMGLLSLRCSALAPHGSVLGDLQPRSRPPEADSASRAWALAFCKVPSPPTRQSHCAPQVTRLRSACWGLTCTRLSPGAGSAPRGHLAMSGDILDCCSLERGDVAGI